MKSVNRRRIIYHIYTLKKLNKTQIKCKLKANEYRSLGIPLWSKYAYNIIFSTQFDNAIPQIAFGVQGSISY